TVDVVRERKVDIYPEVRIEGLSAGTGTGYSKKESQQNAAQMALKKIKNDNDFMEEILAAQNPTSLPTETE
uniref:putative dsRNA-binding protein n=1 Tax=Prevotella heparinolytica TaxID=28113 RepID=UPI0035A083FB